MKNANWKIGLALLIMMLAVIVACGGYTCEDGYEWDGSECVEAESLPEPPLPDDNIVRSKVITADGIVCVASWVEGEQVETFEQDCVAQ